MNIDIKNLALFLRVASLGAIGRAGEEFDLSATNASQRIQTLEAEIGVKLFHRTTRAVTLTPDGQVFIEHAKRILDDVEETRNVFTGNAEAVRGNLRVTVSASFGRSHILPFVPELLSLYPDLHLDLDLSDTVTDIIGQGYDIAFRMGELENSSLLARKLDDDPMMLVASPEYIERAGQPQSPQDLLKHSCIPFGRMRTWQFKDKNDKLHEVTVSGSVSVNLGEAISDLVLSGMGIGLASLWHVGPELSSGKVVPVMPEYRVWPQHKIWAVRPPGRITPARVKVFLDFMQLKIKQTNQARYGEYLKK